MPWGFIATIFSTLFKFWVDHKGKKDRAEKQMVKLANKMDEMARKRTLLKVRIEELEEALAKSTAQQHSVPEEEQ